jgi:hypothetical protein
MDPEVNGLHFIDPSILWKPAYFQIGFADSANHS